LEVSESLLLSNDIRLDPVIATTLQSFFHAGKDDDHVTCLHKLHVLSFLLNRVNQTLTT